MSPHPPGESRDVRAFGVGRKGKRAEAIAELSVVALGGFVMDAAMRIPALPSWGEAVQAESFELVPGGKGFNQAVAARRLGARVSAVGAVGQDAFGEQIIQSLEDEGIQTDGIEISQNAKTPVTIVFGNKDGESSFVGWKNKKQVKVDAALVGRHRRLITNADVLLMTLEVRPEAVSHAVKLVDRYDVLKVLNPAPPLDRPHELSDLPLDKLDLLIPNEWEARKLAGSRGDASRYSIQQVAEYLGKEGGVRCVCVTRAHEGCAVYSDDRYREYAAYEAEASDTTGASDAFCAVLAVYQRVGFDLETSIHHAQAAGAYVVKQTGASRNMPDLERLEQHRRYLDSLRRV